MRKLVFAAGMVLLSLSFCAQMDSLNLDQVIAESLSKNYGVRIAQLDKDIATTLNTPGMAGQMPSIAAGISDQYSTSNIYQRFATGQEITSANASGNNLAAFVALDWTIFSGFRISIERERLEELQSLSEIQLKNQLSQLVRDVTVAYMSYVRVAKQVEQGREIGKLNEERASIAKASYEAGVSSKTFWLQAEVDKNAQQQAVRTLELELINLGQELNLLMGKEENTVPILSFKIPIRSIWDVAQMKQDMLSTNWELTVAKKSNEISELMVKSVSGERLPTVTLSGAYNFSRTDNSAGFSLLNRNYGPVAGINVGVPVFTGGTIGTRKEVALLQTEITKLQYEELKLTLLTRFESLVNAYSNYVQMRELQLTTVELANENFEIAQNRFRLGQAGILEVREAELSYQQAITRLFDLEYEIKISETELLLLSGKL